MPLPATERIADPTHLAAFGQLVGDAQVVALAEGVHLAREPLEFRNSAFEYLVEEKGFTAIAIESGLVEGRSIYDYVRGHPGELSTVLREGISWTFEHLTQNESLIRWLRQYNADPKNRRVNFYGFDVPGSPGNPAARRGPSTALTEALEYLTTVDGPSATAYHLRLDPMLGLLRFDFRPDSDLPGYHLLTERERDALTAAIADLIALFERREASYAALTGRMAYEWALRAAIGAHQVDQWLRQIPLDWQPTCEPDDLTTGHYPQFFAAATEVRDRAQADNLEWILRQEGERAKILIYGHNYHLSGSPVQTSWAGQRKQEVLGSYLRRRLGDRLFAIGNIIRGGEISYPGSATRYPDSACGYPRSASGNVGSAPGYPSSASWHAGSASRLTQPAAGSIEELAAEIGKPAFLLDLRSAPSHVASWLDREREIGLGPDAIKLPVARAFDALLYLERVTPADRTGPIE